MAYIYSKVLVTCIDCKKQFVKDNRKSGLKIWSGRCMSCACINRNKSDEYRKRLSDKNIGKRTGSENNMWKGGVTPMNQVIRASVEYKEWSKKVKERDNYTCQICGKRGCVLNSDHIKPFSLYPELRFDLDNGRTLCEDCHIAHGYSFFKNKNPRKKENIKDELGKRIISEKTRERFRQIGLARIMSQESKDKISENLKVYYQTHLNKRRQTIICMNNHKVYYSNLEAARELNLCDAKIGSVLNGNRAHTKGFKFQKLTEEHLIF